MKKSRKLSIIVLLAGIFFMNFVLRSKSEKKCFELETEIESNYVELIISDDNTAEGFLDVYIHDDEMGYETSSWSEFKGKIKGEKLTVEMTIEIEGNTEYQTETWIYKGDRIIIDESEYKLTDCREE